MGRREHAAIGTTLLVLLGLGPSSACVKDAPLDTLTSPSGSAPEVTTGALLPLAKGNSWTYKVTKEGKTSTKVRKVESEDVVGGDGPYSGETAFKISGTEDGKADEVAWEAVADNRVVRYREQELNKSGKVKAESSWDPPRLVVDSARTHRDDDAKWVEEYAETVTEDDKTETTDESDTWSVDGVDQSVTVPAGTFKALVLRRQGGKKAKTFWYVKGIGKVKEDGDALEELTEYKLGAADDEPSDGDAPSDGDEPSDRDGESSDGDDTAMDPGSDADGDAEPMPGSEDQTTKTPDAGTGTANGTEAAP